MNKGKIKIVWVGKEWKANGRQEQTMKNYLESKVAKVGN